jgi:hypothetical protein
MKESKGFNPATGTSSEGFSRGPNKYAKNHYSGTSNDGALINKGRGPTKGNQDYDANQGAHREPPTRALPAVNPGKDMFTGSAQVRNPGGTKEFPKRGQSTFDFKRGPTKGNTQ